MAATKRGLTTSIAFDIYGEASNHVNVARPPFATATITAPIAPPTLPRADRLPAPTRAATRLPTVQISHVSQRAGCGAGGTGWGSLGRSPMPAHGRSGGTAHGAPSAQHAANIAAVLGH